ncbi:hypothetical protein SDRG_05618 [Saprolegnia diclina VS20]|uniref:Temptin Cys/Cys disulfide domain-containing protein n=1 Tax=Saprolegnia diclina (strain VS20) TaxID=1156394 RepID=T0QFQ9_SAPDV|nr:hypothetical protein SDRG_05618 [Saprolegnia diclina VS20]EQC36784.1 hypothetical protein SDRG_05618 [Saprolegnia diclina VS20]|eukprot:XP_008609565.1 hypothetical protein SDRG_05618 [Saprolegnia diclina VS20]
MVRRRMGVARTTSGILRASQHVLSPRGAGDDDRCADQSACAGIKPALKLKMAALRTALLVVALSLATTSAFSTYRLRIPNGLSVKGFGAVGHVNKVGGGQPTQFGIDFERGGGRWNAAICALDSDGDGATNGEELGDPCCEWRVGLPVRPNPTSPGHPDTFTAAELAEMKCTPSSTEAPAPLPEQRSATAFAPLSTDGSDAKDL